MSKYVWPDGVAVLTTDDHLKLTKLNVAGLKPIAKTYTKKIIVSY